MIDQDGNLIPDETTGSQIIVPLVFLALGLLFGWDIGGNRKEAAALNWAVQTTQQCEKSRGVDGTSSVADCLRAAIDKGEEEKRVEAQGEDHDPRR